jgi:acetyl-CoA carboxylase beta subunit
VKCSFTEALVTSKNLYANPDPCTKLNFKTMTEKGKISRFLPDAVIHGLLNPGKIHDLLHSMNYDNYEQQLRKSSSMHTGRVGALCMAQCATSSGG